MVQFKENKKAFTLIEVIVGMAIIAALISLGTFVLIRFQDTTELQIALSDFQSAVKLQQNNAKNSTKIPEIGTVADFYAIVFENDNFSYYYCEESGSRLNCAVTKRDLLQKSVSEVNINPTGCLGVGFKRSSLEMVAILNEVGDYLDTGTCTVDLYHTGTGNQEQMEFDLTQNKYKVL